MRALAVLIPSLAAVGFAAPPVAHAQADDDWCQRWGDRDRGWFCEVREFTLAADREVIAVDGGANGGIAVEAWDGNEIRVQARVWAHGDTDDQARDLVGQIEIDRGRVLRGDGPRYRHRQGWGVSFRLLVPRESNLDLETTNGGISVEGVAGRVSFRASNGGVELTDLAGDVRGRTTNGGLEIVLTGSEWSGAGMDVRTSNGGVEITVPEDYSAHLETGTVNGRMRVDFPVMVQGRIGRELSIDLGQGGRTIRATTTNGGVVVRRS